MNKITAALGRQKPDAGAARLAAEVEELKAACVESARERDALKAVVDRFPEVTEDELGQVEAFLEEQRTVAAAEAAAQRQKQAAEDRGWRIAATVINGRAGFAADIRYRSSTQTIVKPSLA